ncbi:hypothetical protein [Nocardioides sp.]|uniref:hypothetical protein n=1 Tax=Nocardioides sp. TaxID=35761 RepID=UPI00261F574E|nr:hypothetical protein [Nocardioides sp.]MCW2738661.1 hypothetical protein [Nocardioides sp.]
MNSSHRRSGSRSAAAAVVAGLVLAAGLTSCSDDGTDDTATDPAASSSPSETPSETPSSEPTETTPESGSGAQGTLPATGSAGITEVTMVSATEGGGSASTMAFALDTDQAVADFAAQFEGSFVDTVSAAATAQQAAGSTPYGATVAIGCEAPSRVAIEAGEAGFEVIPRLPKSNIQCLAPMTYVVLFAVPDA